MAPFLLYPYRPDLPHRDEHTDQPLQRINHYYIKLAREHHMECTCTCSIVETQYICHYSEKQTSFSIYIVTNLLS